MRYINCIAISFLLMNMTAKAQTKQPVKFNTYISGGMLVGSTEAPRIQSVTGVYWRTFVFGAGLGYENYVYRSVPLFVTIRKHFAIKKSDLFVYTDVGRHVVIREEKTIRNDPAPGLYLEAGAGLIMNIGNWKHLFLSVGNSSKRLKERETAIGLGPQDVSETIYTYNRLSISLGLFF